MLTTLSFPALHAHFGAALTLGLPLDAWLLIIASVVPGLALTAYYARKAKRIDAARAARAKEQGQ